MGRLFSESVVLDTTKVQIFKQITTFSTSLTVPRQLFQIPQRYRFSSKSQQLKVVVVVQLSCFRYHKGTDFQANHNDSMGRLFSESVVLDTTKVQIFKQITTALKLIIHTQSLFQIPQRYRFSSKSQQVVEPDKNGVGCFRYHKGTDFQANHNSSWRMVISGPVVLDTTKVQIFKQITTRNWYSLHEHCCFRYHKGTDFQANHNSSDKLLYCVELFQIPQRYRFSSKSQHIEVDIPADCSCFRYHKGTDFQANHNAQSEEHFKELVVLDTTKVQIFKQITTSVAVLSKLPKLFQIPQRYRFSSKSQRSRGDNCLCLCCFRYHKGTDFQANHNNVDITALRCSVVLDTTKVQIFKQITTPLKI